MTKFSVLTTQTDTSNSTQFIHQMGSTIDDKPEVQDAEYTPDEFDHVVHLYFDKSLSKDVFMAWNEDVDCAWIFYGIKGSEFN